MLREVAGIIKFRPGTPMRWRRDGRYYVTSTYFTDGERNRSVDWVAYRSGKEWMLGAAVRGENLLHTVIGSFTHLSLAQDKAKQCAAVLGHQWSAK